MPQEIAVEDKTPDLKSSIASAVKEHTTSEGQETGKTDEKVPTASEKKETKPDEEPSEEEKLEAQEAVKLYKALKNPETRGAVIEFMAKQAGYQKAGQLETKKDVKEATRTIVDDLKENLGSEFEFLADKIGPGIEKYLERKRQEDLAEINAKLADQEREKLENQSAAAISKLTEGFFGEGEELPDNVQKEMSKFMDKVPPTPDLSIKEYIELAFNSAIGKLGLHKPDKKKQERTEKNRSDAASRLASDRSGQKTAVAEPDASKIMNRREAILAAIEAAGKE